jgi:hypothetical protein
MFALPQPIVTRISVLWRTLHQSRILHHAGTGHCHSQESSSHKLGDNSAKQGEFLCNK